MADDLEAFYAEIATVEAEVAKEAAVEGGITEELNRPHEPSKDQQRHNEPLPPPKLPPPKIPPPATISQKPVIAAPPRPVIEHKDDATHENQPTLQKSLEISIPPPQQQQQFQQPPPPKHPPGKTVGILRQAAGKKWVDPTLTEWPENDYRIFVGNLGPEVTDAMLIDAFNRYESFQKALVVRNHKTKQSKGYGFVSFGDARFGAQVVKEMHGQYIGSRPCQLKHNKTDKRLVTDSKGRAIKKTVKSAAAPVQHRTAPYQSKQYQF